MDRYTQLIEAARRRPLVGWDDGCDGRIETQAPWDFAADVAALARGVDRMLDLGTGGGERLAALAYRAPLTVATEAWRPNVGVAARRLHPLGIPVVHVDDVRDNAAQDDADDGALPFRDASFALVVNRHESFVAHEVARVLEPGGVFVTQQVADGFNRDYYRWLGLPAPPLPARAWRLDLACAQLTAAGFDIEAGDDGDERVVFHDVGALAWYLKNLPWVLPGFDIDAAEPLLRRLHERGAPIVARQALFRVVARRR